MRHFNAEFSNFPIPLHSDNRLNLVGIEASGSDLQECLENCMIYVEDWHGNFVDMDFDSLSEVDRKFVEAHLQAEFMLDGLYG